MRAQPPSACPSFSFGWISLFFNNNNNNNDDDNNNNNNSCNNVSPRDMFCLGNMCMDTLHKGDDDDDDYNNNNNNNNNNKDIIIQIQRTWNVKTKVTPVTTGATGTISKSLRQYLSTIPGKREIKELQKKKGHIGHCAHTAGSANVKVRNIFYGRSNNTCSTNCKYRTAAKLYNREKCFVTGI